MKKSNFLITCIFFSAMMLLTQGFTTRGPKISNAVLLYGIAYQKASCEGDVRTAAYHATTISDEKNYLEHMQKLKEALKVQYPNSTYIRVGSSRFEYGPAASHFYLLSVKVKGTTCNQREYIAKFGKSLKEAKDAAEKVATESGNTDWAVKESKYW